MKHYLTSTLICLFAMSAVMSACDSGNVAPSLPADHYVLTQGTLVQTTAGVNVVADTVNISICPPGVQCFAPDNASASVRLIQNTETRRVRLFTFIEDGVSRKQYSSSIDSTGVQFGNDVYKVILKARYINTKEKTKAGQAILQVSKL